MSKSIFEHSSPGRPGVTLPPRDTDVPLDKIIPQKYHRQSAARLPEVSKLDVMRHYIELSHKNHFIEKALYPLGSCTMKYNPKIHEMLARHTCFANLHPYQPESTMQGALELLYELQKDLAEVSGMAAVSLPESRSSRPITSPKATLTKPRSSSQTALMAPILPPAVWWVMMWWS